MKMNIIRKIKLNSLGYYKFKDSKEKKLFKFINDNLLNLYSINYHDSIIYLKDDNIIFEHYLNFNWFEVNPSIWNYLQNIINNEETVNLIKFIAKEYYNLNFKDIQISINMRLLY